MTREEALVFPCADVSLVGIHHRTETAASVGVIIIVGGPQYRIGSHRQFLELARHLADNEIPVMRFDYRGMGDSTGVMRGFEQIDEDIRAAIDAFMSREAGLEGVVLWGLCDAASAAMMYAHKDPRVAGLILANPWVHTESGEAKTRLRHYYLSRLVNRDFWTKLVKGRVDYASSLRSISAYLRQAFGKAPESGATGGTGENLHYVERMRRGLEAFTGTVHFILSGKDLTADEFRDLLRGSSAWRGLVQGRADAVGELPAANHTFSSREAKAAVERQTLQWLRDMSDSRGGNSS